MVIYVENFFAGTGRVLFSRKRDAPVTWVSISMVYNMQEEVLYPPAPGPGNIN
jgi:hypothetical protein